MIFCMFVRLISIITDFFPFVLFARTDFYVYSIFFAYLLPYGRCLFGSLFCLASSHIHAFIILMHQPNECLFSKYFCAFPIHYSLYDLYMYELSAATLTLSTFLITQVSAQCWTHFIRFFCAFFFRSHNFQANTQQFLDVHRLVLAVLALLHFWSYFFFKFIPFLMLYCYEWQGKKRLCRESEAEKEWKRERNANSFKLHIMYARWCWFESGDLSLAVCLAQFYA